MRVWKIRNNKGLFSTGTYKPRFTKEGKTWHRLAHVEAHIRQFFSPNSKYADPTGPGWITTDTSTYVGCAVVEYQLTEVSSQTVGEAFVGVQAKDRERLKR